MQAVLCEELIGRSDVLGVALKALEATIDGRGGLLFVTGEAGVGKSRLSREVVGLARGRGATVLFGRAVAAEVPTPFRPITGALLSHFRGRGLPDAPELGAFRPALGRLLPEWRTSTSGEPEPIVVLAEALIRLLRVVAGSSACLLVLEDLHWADPETLALVEYFADALDSEPIMCVATVRSEEPSSARQLASQLGASRAATVIELGSLPDAALDQMASACLRGRLAEEALQFLRNWTDGLPFMVEELLASTVSSGALVNAGDQWVLDASVSPTVPVTFADNIRGRLLGLGPDGERALRFAAVLGRRFDWTLLPGVTGLADTAILSVLRAGVATQLLVAEPGSTFRFRHSLTRDAVLDELLSAERAGLAAQLLVAVQAAHVDLPGEWCEVAAALAEAAGQWEQAASLMLELARRSLALGALGSAELMLERARRSTTARGLQADIDEVALVVLGFAGKTDDAILVGSRLVDRLLQMDASPERRAKAHLGVARAAVTAGRWDVAASQLAKASVVTTDPELEARIQTGAAVVALGQGDPHKAVAAAEKALGTAERLGAHEVACEALEVIGRCQRPSDQRASERAFGRALTIAQEHDLALWQARAMAELGTLDQLNCADDARLQHARELALDCGAFAIAAHVDLSIGALAIAHFDTDAAMRHLDHTQAVAKTMGLSGLHATALGVCALACAVAADAEKVESFAAAAAAGADGDPVALGLAWSARGTLAMMTERRELAHTQLEQAASLFAQLPTSPPVPTRAMHMLLLVQDDSNEQRTRAVRATAEESGLSTDIVSRGYLELADAVTHGRVGRPAEANASFAAADTSLARADGWRHYAYRMVAPDAIADGWGDPTRTLREALAFFEARNLARVADACRALLRDAGVAVPRRTKAAEAVPDSFRAVGVTPREAEILTLLGEGLTNQDIAERVFLSPRTVERHLANVAAKMGTRTRSELVALAARAASG